MPSHRSIPSKNLWQLNGFKAQLLAAGLNAHIDLQNPSQGLGGITWNSVPLLGSVLGINFTQSPGKQEIAFDNSLDGYTRGLDLVARYPESDTQPFSLEAYWRVGIVDSEQVQIDAIVSLQTSLLECYPAAQTVTSLSAHEAWFVPGNGSQVSKLSTELDPQQSTNSEDYAGVVLRSGGGIWSYLEMTHPEDLGTWQADWDQSGNWTLQRLLGGEFQEKGVIRRLRVRGIFLPQEGDIERAPHLLRDFANSPPPLTV